ncbi:MAG: SIMPL domain-containing protein, partial [Brevundimonas sp.]|nr:SIMPL domain-containing protein [Brevundimonas sp.]
MVDNRLIPAAVVGGLLAIGLIGAGGLVGQGVVNARVGDRSVTVRGLAERDVQADLAVLPLRFTASGEVLSEVQA